jgi:hypothetical protein
MNAVFALARQVEGQVFSVSASIIETMKPQIMKSYGAGQYQRSLYLSMMAGKIGFLLMSFITIPLIVLAPDILQLWLKDVPEGLPLFTRLLVFACMMEQLTRGLVYSCQATGRIRWMSLSVSILRMMALPISYIIASCGFPIISIIYVFVLCESIASFARILVMKALCNLDLSYFFKNILGRVLIAFSFSLVFSVLIHRTDSSLLILGLELIFMLIVYSLFLWFIGFSLLERVKLKDLFWSKFKIINRFRK